VIYFSDFSAAGGSGGSGTLGVTTGTANYPATINELNAIPVTVPTGGAYIQKFVLGIFAATNGDLVRPVIYNSSGTAPSTLVAYGPNATITTGMTTIDLPFSSTVFLAAGNYWFAVHGSGASDWQCLGSGSPSRYTSDTFADGPPATWTGGGTFGTYVRVSAPYTN
jgi:hypothetical protein